KQSESNLDSAGRRTSTKERRQSEIQKTVPHEKYGLNNRDKNDESGPQIGDSLLYKIVRLQDRAYHAAPSTRTAAPLLNRCVRSCFDSGESKHSAFSIQQSALSQARFSRNRNPRRQGMTNDARVPRKCCGAEC